MIGQSILESKAGGISLGDSKDTDNFKYFTYLEYPRFSRQHNSLLSNLLTEKIFNHLIHKKTSNNYSFSNAIQSGVECPEIKIGISAGDKESYTLFKDIMTLVIRARHQFDPSLHNHVSEVNPKKIDISPLKRFDYNKYIQSTRIRAVRNISGFALPPGLHREERKELENHLIGIFNKLSKKLGGSYRSIKDISVEEQNELRNAGLLFQIPGRFSSIFNSGSAREWPEARGIFISKNKECVCWCNEEDHLTIISMKNNADIESVFKNFIMLDEMTRDKIECVGNKIMHSSNLGFITSCPSNLGTGLRVSIKIKLNKLIQNKDLLYGICREKKLDLRGFYGESSLVSGYIFDISNSIRIGFTETELVQQLINGIAAIISLEEQL